mmetsp:Transcript_711/g.1574  ORF Transcript_711/g.1574 Transcript_711/m.1574 type:complete len:403 (+) Transcript_711:2-1210(+)
MPNRETLRQVNVAEFAAAQRSKTPLPRRSLTPQPRRSLTPGKIRQQRGSIYRSKSPSERSDRSSRSRDIVQEVYDRMGVNYVRGQNSVELYDSTSSISINRGHRSVVEFESTSSISINPLTKNCTQSYDRESPVPSILSRKSGAYIQNDQPKENSSGRSDIVAQRNSYSSLVQNHHLPSAETRDEQDEKSLNRNSTYDDEERLSLRSARSVKSMVSVFGGSKSLPNNRSGFFIYKPKAKIIDAAPNVEKIIDVRNDKDADATMSVVSFDEAQWANKQQQQQGNRNGPHSYGRASFQNSKVPNSSKNVGEDSNNTPWDDEMIDKMIEEKLQARLANLDARFAEKLRQIETHTNARLDKMQAKLDSILKEESPEIKKPDKPAIKTPKDERSFSYERVSYESFRL